MRTYGWFVAFCLAVAVFLVSPGRILAEDAAGPKIEERADVMPPPADAELDAIAAELARESVPEGQASEVSSVTISTPRHSEASSMEKENTKATGDEGAKKLPWWRLLGRKAGEAPGAATETVTETKESVIEEEPVVDSNKPVPAEAEVFVEEVKAPVPPVAEFIPAETDDVVTEAEKATGEQKMSTMQGGEKKRFWNFFRKKETAAKVAESAPVAEEEQVMEAAEANITESVSSEEADITAQNEPAPEQAAEIAVVVKQANVKNSGSQPVWKKLAFWEHDAKTENVIAENGKTDPAEAKVEEIKAEQQTGKKSWFRSSGNKNAASARNSNNNQLQEPMPTPEEKARIVELLDKIANSTDYAEQVAARKSLGAMGSVVSRDALVLLDHHDPIVQVLGVLVLRESKGSAAYAALCRLLNSDNAKLRHQAGMALVKMTGQEIPYHYNDIEENRLVAARAWSDYLLKQGLIGQPAVEGGAIAAADSATAKESVDYESRIESWRQMAVQPAENKNGATGAVSQQQEATTADKGGIWAPVTKKSSAKTTKKKAALWDLLRDNDRKKGSVWDKMQSSESEKKNESKKSIFRRASETKTSIFDNVKYSAREIRAKGPLTKRLSYAGQGEDGKVKVEGDFYDPSEDY